MADFTESLKKTYRCNDLFGDNHQAVERTLESLIFTDPSLLSKASAYEAIWKSRLPVNVQDILEQNQTNHLKVDYHRKTISLLTDNMLSIYQLNCQTDKRTLQIPIQDMIVFDQLPLFDVCADSLSAMIINTYGKLRLVQYGMNQVEFEVDLAIGDSISALKMICANQALLGTLSGEIYLFQLDNHQQPHLFTFYQYQSWFDTFILTGSYYRTTIPSLSCQTKSKCHHVVDKVIHLQTVDSVHYVGYAKGIQVWGPKLNNQLELLAQCDLKDMLKEEVIRHIPSSYSKENIYCEIIDMNIHPKSDIVLLVAYTLPDMRGYHQFLVLRCQLEINHEKEALDLQVVYSASMSYTTLQKNALLTSTSSIAFVTFENTVIAISTSKKSVFEEAIHVYDQILFTEVVSGIAEHHHTALIYTQNNGVIQFSVNVDAIQQSWLINNMYSRAVRNIQESDTNVFEAQLEQAVFFGDSPQSPLRFILRQHNQENIPSATLKLSNRLSKGNCWLLPITTEDRLYLCAQNYFQNRILKVVKENELIDKFSEQDKQALIRNSQMSTLAYALGNCIMERQSDAEFMDCMMHSVQPSVLPETEINIITLLKTKSKKAMHLLEAFYQTAHSEHIGFRLLCQFTEIMANVLTTIHKFENQCILVYMNNPNINFSSTVTNYLLGLWCLAFETEKKINESETETSGLMITTANLILDSLLDEANQTNHNTVPFEKAKAVIFSKLLIAYGKDVALMSQFAQVYGGIPFVIDYIQSTEQKREGHLAFIHHIGFDYFSALLSYFCQKENTYNEIEFYCNQYPHFMSKLINDFTVPKIAWVHYVRQKEYKKSYEQLHLYLNMPMSEQERKEATAWQKLIEACIHEMET
ncbi:hypothetical protein BD560DRAFT_386570 [Blakeslea trispora]|nr:hypothetical protein BD560DRAFT_386570 [Blakeslea trispora]